MDVVRYAVGLLNAITAMEQAKLVLVLSSQMLPARSVMEAVTVKLVKKSSEEYRWRFLIKKKKGF